MVLPIDQAGCHTAGVGYGAGKRGDEQRTQRYTPMRGIGRAPQGATAREAAEASLWGKEREAQRLRPGNQGNPTEFGRWRVRYPDTR